MRIRHLFGTFGSLFLFLLVLCAEPGRAAGDSAVITAARDGDVQALRALIAKRANVNEPAGDGSTALLLAVYNSNLEMTRALLAAGDGVAEPAGLAQLAYQLAAFVVDVAAVLMADVSGRPAIEHLLVDFGGGHFAGQLPGSSPAHPVGHQEQQSPFAQVEDFGV